MSDPIATHRPVIRTGFGTLDGTDWSVRVEQVC